MKRAPIVIGGTLLGLGGVLSFHPHPRTLGAARPAAAAAVNVSRSLSAAAKPARHPAKPRTATRTVTGNDVPNQYGDVQVRVSFSGGKVTKVTAVVLPASQPKSQEISAYAAPQLAQEALAAQSAQIDAVAGASYTSQSYQASLQSALDRLGVRASS